MAKTKTSAPKVIVKQPEPPAEPIAAEVLASAIVEIAAGMKKLDDSRLKRDAIVTLIARTSGLPRQHIEVVMNNLEQLEATWLKPAPRRGE